MRRLNNSKDPEVIRSILESARTIAVVGFSSEMGRAGYYVPAYLHQKGYRIVPVNPKMIELILIMAINNVYDLMVLG